MSENKNFKLIEEVRVPFLEENDKFNNSNNNLNKNSSLTDTKLIATKNNNNKNESLDDGGVIIYASCEMLPTIIDITSSSKVPANNEKDNNNKVISAVSWHKKFGGICFALLAAMCFSLVSTIVKLLRHEHDAFSIAFWRQFGNVIPSIPLVLYFRYAKKQPIFDNIWPISENWPNVRGLGIRSILGASCVVLKFLALDYLTIADSTVIMYGGPIFTIVLAHFFLKEKCGIVPILVSFWCLFGVGVIARPPFLTGAQEFDTNILIGTGIVLVVVLFQGTVTILIRKVRKIHFSVMTLIFGLWGVVQSSFMVYIFGKFTVPVGLRDISLMTSLALCAFCGQICTILALKLEQAGSVSLVRTSDVIFAFIFQAVILHMVADIYSVIGACIVLSGVVIIAFRKWLSTQDEKNPTRRYFGFILK